MSFWKKKTNAEDDDLPLTDKEKVDDMLDRVKKLSARRKAKEQEQKELETNMTRMEQQLNELRDLHKLLTHDKNELATLVIQEEDMLKQINPNEIIHEIQDLERQTITFDGKIELVARFFSKFDTKLMKYIKALEKFKGSESALQINEEFMLLKEKLNQIKDRLQTKEESVNEQITVPIEKVDKLGEDMKSFNESKNQLEKSFTHLNNNLKHLEKTLEHYDLLDETVSLSLEKINELQNRTTQAHNKLHPHRFQSMLHLQDKNNKKEQTLASNKPTTKDNID